MSPVSTPTTKGRSVDIQRSTAQFIVTAIDALDALNDGSTDHYTGRVPVYQWGILVGHLEDCGDGYYFAPSGLPSATDKEGIE